MRVSLLGNDLVPSSRPHFPVGLTYAGAGLFVALLIQSSLAVLAKRLFPALSVLLIAADESITTLNLHPVLVVAAAMCKAQLDAWTKLDVGSVVKLNDT